MNTVYQAADKSTETVSLNAQSSSQTPFPVRNFSSSWASSSSTAPLPNSKTVQPDFQLPNELIGTVSLQGKQTLSLSLAKEQVNSRSSVREMGTKRPYRSSDDHFLDAQKERQETFLAEEDERQHRFRVSEAQRDICESERITEFSQKLEYWSKAFQQQLKSHMHQFNNREQERIHTTVRQNVFAESSEERFSDIFDLLFSIIKQQAEAEEAFEETWIEMKKHNVWSLYEARRKRLHDASVERYHWFREKYIEQPKVTNSIATPSYARDDDFVRIHIIGCLLLLIECAQRQPCPSAAKKPCSMRSGGGVKGPKISRRSRDSMPTGHSTYSEFHSPFRDIFPISGRNVQPTLPVPKRKEKEGVWF